MDNIPGSERITFEVVMSEDFFNQGDVINTSSIEEELEILHKRRCDRGSLYLCSKTLNEEDIEIMIKHFKFLMKYGLI